MPLLSNALTTLDAVKSYLKIDPSIIIDDIRLEDLIIACSAAIENYCGRKFLEQSYIDEEYDGTGRKHILLRQYPVKSVESVKIDGVTVDSTDFKIKKNNGMLIHNQIWPTGDVNITVSYTAGFSEIPADLELACRHYVMSYFKADMAAFSTTFQDGFVFRADAMPVQVKMLLQPYKKVV